MKRWALALFAILWAGMLPAQDLGLALTASRDVTRPVLRLDEGFGPTNPATVLVIGDSLAQGFGLLLQERARSRGFFVEVINQGRVSTGLSRGDYYDWPSVFASEAQTLKPDFTIAHFGANDRQNVITNTGSVTYGDAAWQDAYASRIEALLVTARQVGSLFYVIGPAPDRNTRLNAHMDQINPIFEQKAAEQGAIYFPLAEFTAGPDGQWVRTMEVDGQVRQLRSADGSHFTSTGYGLVADRLLDDIAKRYPALDPNTPRIRTIGLQ